MRSRTGGGLPLPSRGLDARQRLAQVAQAVGRVAELVAELVVVALEPAGADAEDQPAARDVVDGAGHVGQQLRVAVAVAGHERAELGRAR